MKSVNPFELPSIPFVALKNLPSRSGVYFVLSDDEVLYIGQAENIRQRWMFHEKSALIKHYANARIAWAECDICLLDMVEIPLIQQYQPKFNHQHRVGFIDASSAKSTSKNALLVNTGIDFDNFQSECNLLKQAGLNITKLHHIIAFIFLQNEKVFPFSKEDALRLIHWVKNKHLPLITDELWGLVLYKAEEAFRDSMTSNQRSFKEITND